MSLTSLSVGMPEILSRITSLLGAYDISRLLFCGDRVLNQVMQHRGGVKEFRLALKSFSPRIFPSIAGSLRCLVLFSLTTNSSLGITLIDRVELSLLPPTLTRLELFFANAYASLWDIPPEKSEKKPTPINLKELFPALKSLKYPQRMDYSDAQLVDVLPSTIESFDINCATTLFPVKLVPRSVTHLCLQQTQNLEQDTDNDPCFPPLLQHAGLAVYESENLVKYLPSSLTALHMTSPSPYRVVRLERLFKILPPALKTFTLGLQQTWHCSKDLCALLPRTLQQIEFNNTTGDADLVQALPSGLLSMNIYFQGLEDSEKDVESTRIILSGLPHGLKNFQDSCCRKNLGPLVGNLPRSLTAVTFKQGANIDVSDLPENIETLKAHVPLKMESVLAALEAEGKFGARLGTLTLLSLLLFQIPTLLAHLALHAPNLSHCSLRYVSGHRQSRNAGGKVGGLGNFCLPRSLLSLELHLNHTPFPGFMVEDDKKRGCSPLLKSLVIQTFDATRRFIQQRRSSSRTGALNSDSNDNENDNDEGNEEKEEGDDKDDKNDKDGDEISAAQKRLIWRTLPPSLTSLRLLASPSAEGRRDPLDFVEVALPEICKRCRRLENLDIVKAVAKATAGSIATSSERLSVEAFSRISLLPSLTALTLAGSLMPDGGNLTLLDYLPSSIIRAWLPFRSPFEPSPNQLSALRLRFPALRSVKICDAFKPIPSWSTELSRQRTLEYAQKYRGYADVED